MKSKLPSAAKGKPARLAVSQEEQSLRALSQRLFVAQEAERAAVALELHGHITQLLCAVMLRAEVLVKKISPQGKATIREAKQLRAMLSEAATTVERICRELHPSVLDHLGLSAVIQNETTAFARRTGLILDLQCPELDPRLPLQTELACYRILQEALRNAEQHAHAHHLTLQLTKHCQWVELSIIDDGIGFNPRGASAVRGLGMLGMIERASSVGGQVDIISSPGHGTILRARFSTDSARNKAKIIPPSLYPN